MSRLEVVHHPHPALRWKSREVTRIDAELRHMIAEMFELMYEHRGIGLAANQVALPYRLFVINPTGDAAEKSEERVFINPQITRRKGSHEDEEGCLSLPEIFGPVSRATRIVVDAFDLDGTQFELDLEDLPARIIQHEYDHLDGVLFVDRVAPGVLPRLQPLISDLELQFRNRQNEGTIPSDVELKARLQALQKARTAG
jgi:peptide deformylase